MADLLPCNPAEEEVEAREGRQLSDQQELTVSMDAHGEGFLLCFCHDAEGATTVV